VEGKARNRTLANKLVKEAWDEIARAVGKRMGQEVEARPVKLAVPAPSSVKGKEIAVEKARQEEEGEEGDKPVKKLSKRAERAAKGAAKALLPKPAIMMNSARMAAMAAGSDDDEGSDDEGPVSGSDMDDDHEIQKELARLGGDDAGDWSGSSDEEGVQSDADDDDNLGSNSSLPLVAPKPAKSTAKPKTKDSAPRKPITSSAFLPSLASGYISYSDSDGEDAKWVKEAEKGEKKEERKNRRGQRARQACVSLLAARFIDSSRFLVTSQDLGEEVRQRRKSHRQNDGRSRRSSKRWQGLQTRKEDRSLRHLHSLRSFKSTRRRLQRQCATRRRTESHEADHLLQHEGRACRRGQSPGEGCGCAVAGRSGDASELGGEAEGGRGVADPGVGAQGEEDHFRLNLRRCISVIQFGCQSFAGCFAMRERRIE
jgi:hypothetical protein